MVVHFYFIRRCSVGPQIRGAHDGPVGPRLNPTLITSVGLVVYRVDELYAEGAAISARRRRDVHQLVRDDADVLSVAQFDADRHVRAQPLDVHQQRQLLVDAVATDTRTSQLRRLPAPIRISHWSVSSVARFCTR